MSPELADAIEKARDHKMTPSEKFEQRVSFVFGQQDHDKPGKAKDEIRRMLADSGGWPLAEMEELATLRAQVSQLTADLEVAVNGLRAAETDLGDMPFGNKGGHLVRWHKFALDRLRATLNTIRKDG